MAIVNLKGTVWQFKRTITKPSSSIYASINFKSNNGNTNYSSLNISINGISGIATMYYGGTEVWYNGEWKDFGKDYNYYGKIEIIDGADVHNQTFINWLTQNATLLYETNTYSHLYAGQNKILVDAAIRDGNGKKIDTTYATKDEVSETYTTKEEANETYATKEELPNLIEINNSKPTTETMKTFSFNGINYALPEGGGSGGSSSSINIVNITQEGYNMLETPDENTLYVITES